jgi:hypothetical protein
MRLLVTEHREAMETRRSDDEDTLWDTLQLVSLFFILIFFLDAEYVSTIGYHFNIRMQPFTNTFEAPQVCFVLVGKHSFIPAGRSTSVFNWS